ncbi:hypothetical protein AAFF_G00321870 [Aldrovandia affinis]|uniref:Uncharacterized protein n=1 Tax=Aldrovandia affinis TaxID=143900 RepID=A0AAD7SMA8_9TELE|nr:hypothetical protein AAFF_G00321870 [Aldrovandia affinis]
MDDCVCVLSAQCLATIIRECDVTEGLGLACMLFLHHLSDRVRAMLCCHRAITTTLPPERVARQWRKLCSSYSEAEQEMRSSQRLALVKCVVVIHAPTQAVDIIYATDTMIFPALPSHSECGRTPWCPYALLLCGGYELSPFSQSEVIPRFMFPGSEQMYSG